MLKEKETGEGADPPRVMALDDYFESDGQVRVKNKTVIILLLVLLLSIFSPFKSPSLSIQSNKYLFSFNSIISTNQKELEF